MNRYLYSLILTFALAGPLFFVPGILIEHRFGGSIAAIGISIVVGPISSILFITSIRKFPGQGLPEIFRTYLPLPFTIPYLIFLSLMFFAAGGFVVNNYSQAVQRFINPDFNFYVIVVLFILTCGWLAATDSWSVLYFMVILIVVNIPLMGYILLKTMGQPNMNWDAVRVVGHHWRHLPQLKELATAFFIFSGYLNLAIFNRCFVQPKTFKYLWTIPVIGTLVLLTTFLIPIGINGTMGVGDFIYVWISTTDSIRLQYGFVERMIYVFLLLYLSFAIVFICTVWHVGLELMKGAIGIDGNSALSRRIWAAVILVVIGLLILWASKLSEKQWAQLGEKWFILAFFTAWTLSVLIFVLARRKKA